MSKLDPDIIGGYETEKKTLNYIYERAIIYNINLNDVLSRCPQNIK